MIKRIFIIAITAAIFASCGDKSASPANGDLKDGEPVVTSFEELDIKPRFGGCDEIKDPVELKSCSDKKMAQFISTNLQYPENARKMKIEGKAVVAFVIEPNGSITDIEAITDLGGGLEEEAIRVFNLMNEKKMWWKPGWKDGKRQRVKLQLPINFKM